MKKSSPVLVVVAWSVVSIPLVWGIYNTALNAAKLFTTTPGTPAGTAGGTAAGTAGGAAAGAAAPGR